MLAGNHRPSRWHAPGSSLEFGHRQVRFVRALLHSGSVTSSGTALRQQPSRQVGSPRARSHRDLHGISQLDQLFARFTVVAALNVLRCPDTQRPWRNFLAVCARCVRPHPWDRHAQHGYRPSRWPQQRAPIRSRSTASDGTRLGGFAGEGLCNTALDTVGQAPSLGHTHVRAPQSSSPARGSTAASSPHCQSLRR
jgi:hypothetical protein